MRKIQTMGLSMKLVFTLIIQLCPCSAVEVSKACYGSGGSCINHKLRCESGSIAIQEAFYTNSTACSNGVSSCRNIDVHSVPLTGERYHFSDTELDSVYRNCSTESACTLPTTWSERGTRTFSAIIYLCINGTQNLNITCNESLATTETAVSVDSTRTKSNPSTATQETTSTPRSSTQLGPSSVVPPNQIRTDAETSTGTVVGITIPICIIIAGVVTAVIILKRRNLRQKDKDGNISKPKSKVHSLEKSSSKNYSTTANEYREMAPKTHKMRSPCYDNADNDDHFHRVEYLQTKNVLPEYKHSGVNESDKLQLQMTKNVFSVHDCMDENYHELEKRTEHGSSVYNLASKIASKNVTSQPGEGWSTEYVLAGNISKGGKESQHAKKGSSNHDDTGGNTYHVLERQSALNDSSDYDYAGGNDYHEVQPEVPNTSDYDYATCGKQQVNHSSSRNTQTRETDYDHFGRQPARANDHHDTSLSVAGTLEGSNANEEVYSYNHLNEKAVSNINADSTYNTTSSTRHKMDSSTNDMEDHYGYNHLGTEHKKNLPQNEYDTTASAIRDLARMNGDMEDSMYDHAHLLTSDSSPSGMTNVGFQESDYDHASTTTAHKDECESNVNPPNRSHQEERVADVYTLAGEADTNPYQLAK